MSSGRHVGYRVKEFREREVDVGVFAKEIGYPKGEYDWVRKGDKDYGRDHARGRESLEYRSRFIRKNNREREEMKGGYRSTSSQSDSENHGMVVPRRCGFADHPKDREPGELSSGGSVDSEDQVNNESQSSSVHNIKRKSSPVVWDRDDRHISLTVKTRNISAEFCRESPKSNFISNACVQTLLADDGDIRIFKASPSRSDLLSDFSECPAETTSLLVQEEHCVNNLATGAVDNDGDYVPPRTIISYRWENNAYSSTDEGEISDYVDIQKLTSSEFGQVKREGDECVRTSSGDSYHDGDDTNADDQIYDGVNVSHSESEDDFGYNGAPEPASPPRRCVNMLQGCRSVGEFERLNKINEGTYGVVFRAKDKKTGEIVALKKVKMENEREGFPLTSLREINILLSSHHPSIVDVKEVVIGSNLDSIFMVMEYMEHDLRGLVDTMKQPFSQSEVKCLMLQLLGGIDYLHNNWVLHRDLKTSNLLLNNRGELKICDFGLARQYGSPLKPYTQLVVTLWYRAPELLLGAKQYSTAIDMWSLGCIMAELLIKEPLFNGKSEVDQLDKIFKVLGTPNEKIWPGLSELPGAKVNFVKHKYNLLRTKFPATSFTGSPVLSNAGFDLLSKLLTYDPDKVYNCENGTVLRITADEALSHEWFREVPLPKSKEFMPTFPAEHVQDRRMRRVATNPDPLEKQMRKEYRQGELGIGGLFCQ